MSDHWNSIANLLKTPSLAPAIKKSEGPPKPPKATALVEQSVDVEQPVSPGPEPAKPKSEPSRLRSSWDAVATFFGVAAPEHAPEAPAQQGTTSLSKSETSPTTKSSSSGSRRTKPSMWAESTDDRTAATEPSPPPRTADPSVLSHDIDSRVRSRGNERGPRADESESRPDLEPRRATQTKRDEEFGAIDPERRSLRQQPRRGRQADVRSEAPFAESALDSNLNEDIPRMDSEISDQDHSPRSESSRAPRGRGQRTPSEGDVRPERNSELSSRSGREERPVRPPRAGSADRQDRSARPERERPQRAARQDSPEQSDRQPRSEGSTRPVRSESSDRPIKSDREERPHRTDRAERPPRAEGAERSERPVRQDRPERNERPARPDRPPRTENIDRAAPRDRPARPERTGSLRGERAVRDRNADRPGSPTSPIPKKPTAFGSGIHEDDSFEFIENSSEILDDFELADDRVENDSDDSGSRETIEREARPRRRRGRGKRSEIRDDDADTLAGPEDLDDDSKSDDDASELIGRNSRIPSWQDAIGTLVATNMENHQRNQSQNRGPRGRSPRRDR